MGTPWLTQVKNDLARELHGAHRELSGVDPHSIYPNIPGADDAQIEFFLEQSTHYDFSEKSWISIPKGVIKGPEILFQPYADIIEATLEHFSVTKSHVQTTHIKTMGKLMSWKAAPDLCIMGSGNKFNLGPIKTNASSACNIEEANEFERQAQETDGNHKHEDADSDYLNTRQKKSKMQRDLSFYFNCVCPIDIKTEKMMERTAIDDVVLQMAIYVRQCFDHQPNRRYACGIMCTEESFRLIVFDRVGTMRTTAIDIHKHAKVFVRTILGIASFQANHLLSCFDPAIFREDHIRCHYPQLHLKLCYDSGGTLKKNIRIVVNPKAFARKAIRGRGTRCWYGITYGTNIPVAAKESWRSKGRNPESTLLKMVIGIDGIGQMLYYYEEDTNTVSQIRAMIFHGVKFAKNDFDRTFSRIVLVAYGPPIHFFTTALQLLQAFRDAIAGHRGLWMKGILHRDVSNHNVLLGKEDAKPGNLGVLIDLDMAIAIKNYVPNKEPRTGVRAFQSVMVLRSSKINELHVQDHLDDLESFLHILLWICMVFVAPHKMTATQTLDRDIEDPDDHTCAYNKLDLLKDPNFYSTPYFKTSRPFTTLLTKLSRFFRGEITRKDDITTETTLMTEGVPAGHFPSLQDIHGTAGTRDHDTVIGYFDEAIMALVNDPSTSPDAKKHTHVCEIIDLNENDVGIPNLDEGRLYGIKVKQASFGDVM